MTGTSTSFYQLNALCTMRGQQQKPSIVLALSEGIDKQRSTDKCIIAFEVDMLQDSPPSVWIRSQLALQADSLHPYIIS